jgi:hypothetical protein
MPSLMCIHLDYVYDMYFSIFKCLLFLKELYTRDVLFDDIESESQLIETVCVNKERPPIPSNCPESLRNLLTACWHDEPNSRVL